MKHKYRIEFDTRIYRGIDYRGAFQPFPNLELCLAENDRCGCLQTGRPCRVEIIVYIDHDDSP